MATSNKINVAVVGGGLSAVAACLTLRAAGLDAALITKSTGWGSRWIYPGMLAGAVTAEAAEAASKPCKRIAGDVRTVGDGLLVLEGGRRIFAEKIVFAAGSKPSLPLPMTGPDEYTYVLHSPGPLASLLRALPGINDMAVITGCSSRWLLELLVGEAAKRGVRVHVISRAGCAGIEAKQPVKVTGGRGGVFVFYARYKAVLVDRVVVIPDCSRDYSPLAGVGGKPAYLPIDLVDARVRRHKLAYAGLALEGAMVSGRRVTGVNTCSAAASGIVAGISLAGGKPPECLAKTLLFKPPGQAARCVSALEYLLYAEGHARILSGLRSLLRTLSRANVLLGSSAA